jgi:PAS domain S-box-containing protein
MSNQELRAKLEELFSGFPLVAPGQSVLSPEPAKPSRNGHDRYLALVENLPIGFYRITAGAQARLLMANKAFLDLLGVERAQVLPLDEPDDPALSDHALTWGPVTESEIQFKRKDGTPLRCWIASRAICRPGGEAVYYDCVVMEVARRAPAEPAPAGVDGWAKLMLDALPDAMLVIRPDRCIADANAAAERLLGYSRAELERLPPDALYVGQRFDVGQIVGTLAAARKFDLTLDMRHKGGHMLWIEHQFRALGAAAGQPAAVVAVLRQVERPKAVEKEIFTEPLGLSVFYPCVYLGNQEGVGTRCNYPTQEHYCHAHASPQRVELSQQASVCIGGDWTACPLYQAATSQTS